MYAIENWSKTHVHGVMREVLFSFNYMWFLMEGWARQHCPEKFQNEEFKLLSEEFGRYQAKRLEKFIDNELTGIERLTAFVRHSHWCAFEDIELTPFSDKRLRMRTLGCTAQKAARKWGMSHYDCSQSGLRLRIGFFRQVHPDANVERIFTPLDQKATGAPLEADCEWIVSF